MIGFQLFMIVAILFLAGKDSSSYKLKDKRDNSLTLARIKRFHRDGVALNALFVIPFIYFDPINWQKYIVYTLLLRLSIFDIAFNYWAGLNYKSLGSTAWWDQKFAEIFGEDGAVKKSIIFLLILIGLNILR